MSVAVRQELGDFSSIVCLKALIVGVEETLGAQATEVALIAAGRSRGRKLAQDLDIVGSSESLSQLGVKIAEALGKNGTRLCKIEKVVEEGDIIKVYTSETVCSAGEPQGSPRKCTFTLGAVWGTLESILTKRLDGKHTESVLRGGRYDVFEFVPKWSINV